MKPETVQFCPECASEFPDGTHCPTDGTELMTLSDERHLTGRVIDGRYEVKAMIALGGMGVVYKATQLAIDRDVAIKFLRRSFTGDTTAVSRFFKEAKSASKLNHAHTVTVHDFGRTDDELLYITMELLTGRSLGDELGRCHRLLPSRAFKILSQVCESLEEAHGVGIVHRDLKPQNINLETRGYDDDFVKVVDFGLAKAIQTAGKGTSGVTAEGVVAGTPAYMSPEAAQSQTLDARADIYSMGVLLFEMLTGERPYDAVTAVSLLIKHIHDPIPLPHQRGIALPPGAEELLNRMLAKDPEERPSDVTSLRAELETCRITALRWEETVSLDLLPPDLPPPIPAYITADTRDSSPASATPDPQDGSIGLMETGEVRLLPPPPTEPPPPPPRQGDLNLGGYLDSQDAQQAAKSRRKRILIGLVVLAALVGAAVTLFPDMLLP